MDNNYLISQFYFLKIGEGLIIIRIKKFKVAYATRKTLLVKN